MGSRAQVEVKMFGDESSVFLYTHWESYSLPGLLARILDTPQARDRWTDSEYLARIIFENMIKGNIGQSTGFGIGTAAHGDLDFPPIVVDSAMLTVTLNNTLTYEEYIKAYKANTDFNPDMAY